MHFCKMEAKKQELSSLFSTPCALISSLWSCLTCPPAAAEVAQGGDHSEARSRLAGPLLVQALPGVHRLPAVLHPQDEGSARAEEAEDRGSLRGALQEVKQRHGEQDHAAAEEDRRAGKQASGAVKLSLTHRSSHTDGSCARFAFRARKTARSTRDWPAWRRRTPPKARRCAPSWAG